MSVEQTLEEIHYVDRPVRADWRAVLATGLAIIATARVVRRTKNPAKIDLSDI